MKLVTSILVAALSVPVSAGVIRHDTPDAWYTGFAGDPALSSLGLISSATGESSSSCADMVINGSCMFISGDCATDTVCSISVVDKENATIARETGASVNFVSYGNSNISLTQTDGIFDISPTSTHSGNLQLLPASIAITSFDNLVVAQINTYPMPEANSLLLAVMGLLGLWVRRSPRLR